MGMRTRQVGRGGPLKDLMVAPQKYYNKQVMRIDVMGCSPVCMRYRRCPVTGTRFGEARRRSRLRQSESRIT